MSHHEFIGECFWKGGDTLSAKNCFTCALDKVKVILQKTCRNPYSDGIASFTPIFLFHSAAIKSL